MTQKIRQLTVSGLGPDLERALVSLARADRISLSRAAMKLMRKGAGLSAPLANRPVATDALDGFFGTFVDVELVAGHRAPRKPPQRAR